MFCNLDVKLKERISFKPWVLRNPYQQVGQSVLSGNAERESVQAVANAFNDCYDLIKFNIDSFQTSCDYKLKPGYPEAKTEEQANNMKQHDEANSGKVGMAVLLLKRFYTA